VGEDHLPDRVGIDADEAQRVDRTAQEGAAAPLGGLAVKPVSMTKAADGDTAAQTK
jgi:hypothetical protein